MSLSSVNFDLSPNMPIHNVVIEGEACPDTESSILKLKYAKQQDMKFAAISEHMYPAPAALQRIFKFFLKIMTERECFLFLVAG